MADQPKLPRLPLNVPIGSVRDNKAYASTEFQRWWQLFAERIETRLGALELAALESAVAAAQDAAVAAQSSADDAAAAVVTVDATATAAQASADALASANALQNSVVTGCTITALAATAQISVSSHTRVYGDGTSVSVTGATISAAFNSGVAGTVLYDVGYYVYYDQPSRAGGAVTYFATDDPIDAAYSAANPNRHYVGAVRSPPTIGSPDFTGLTIAPSNIDRV